MFGPPLRQTALPFRSRAVVSPMTALEERMEKLGVREDDLREQFVLGSGPGGQKINKTASCVRLLHQPSGVEVKCQEGRSREANRELARQRLCEIIEAEAREKRRRQARQRARKRYAKRKESRAQRAKRLQLKKIRSEKKKLRGPVARD